MGEIWRQEPSECIIIEFFENFFIANAKTQGHNECEFWRWAVKAQYYWNLNLAGRLQDGKEKSGKKDMLIVASKTKAYIKSKGMMTSSDAIGTLNDAIYDIIDAAIARTQANRRSTVKPQDL